MWLKMRVLHWKKTYFVDNVAYVRAQVRKTCTCQLDCAKHSLLVLNSSKCRLGYCRIGESEIAPYDSFPKIARWSLCLMEFAPRKHPNVFLKEGLLVMCLPEEEIPPLMCEPYAGVSKLRSAGQNPARDSIPSDLQSRFTRPKRHLVNNERLIFLRKTCWFGGMQHVPKQSHYVNVRPSNRFVTALVALGLKSVEMPGLIHMRSGMLKTSLWKACWLQYLLKILVRISSSLTPCSCFVLFEAKLLMRNF